MNFVRDLIQSRAERIAWFESRSMEALSAPVRHNYMESPGEEPPLAVMASWAAEHRSFAMETYFKNNESPITVQRIFRRHFRLGRHDRVPDHRTIVRW